MTKEEFGDLYGQSVYEFRLSVALQLLTKYRPDDALELADEFIESLLAEESEAVKGSYG